MSALTEMIAPPEDFARASERFAERASTVTVPPTAESRELPSVVAIVLAFASELTFAVETRTRSEALHALDRGDRLVVLCSLLLAWS